MTFGDVPLRSIRRSHVEAWAKNITTKAEAAMMIPTNADVAKVLNAAEPERRPKSRPGFTALVALCAFAGLRRGARGAGR